MSVRQPFTFAALAAIATACSSAPTTQQLAQEAAQAMGGRERLQHVQTITMREGEGSRYRLGQSVKAGDADQPGTIREVVEIADLAGGRASLDYALLSSSGFQQRRKEVLTKKDGRLVGIETVPGRPVTVTSSSGLFSWGTQNHPDFLLRRNVVTDAPQSVEFNGRTHQWGTARLGSEEIGLYFDPQSKLLAGFEVTDTETMLGDVRAQYIFEDYRTVDGVMLPHKVTVRKAGQPYSDVQFGSMAINDPAAQAALAIPAELDEAVDRALAAGDHYSPIELVRVADRVYLARAYSHNSLVVEFPN
jgi:hypothetical protein